MQSVFKFNYIFILFATLVAAVPLGAQITARVGVSPELIMVGSQAEYIVVFNNTTSIPNINTPRVDGLEFSGSMGTSSYQQYVNGRVTVETRATWGFRATRAGRITIPGRSVRISGEDVEIPPVTVDVVPMDEEARSRAYVRLELPDGPFFVGEAIPAKVGLFVRSDAGKTNYARPTRVGEAFISSDIKDNPTRSRTLIEGRVYEALIWDTLLTPIKSGPARLSFTQDISIQLSSTDNRFPSIFNLSRGRVENYTLESDPLETEILPLPREDQPDSFRDAVGEFTITADLSSRDLQVGEPITLTLSIDGKGNFDRISPPEIPEWEDWRVYPPKVSFSPRDELGYAGLKTFEYILIPQSVSITEIPEVRYATFNPGTKTYSTTVLSAEPVTVKPSPIPVNTGPVFSSTAGDDSAGEQAPDSLLPIRPDPGTLLKPGGPVWKQAPFWILNGFAALGLLLIAWWLGKRRRLRTDDRLARRHMGGRKIRKALQAAQTAAKAGEAADFFNAARYAIQERVSHLASTPVEAKTLVSSDCLALLEASKVPSPTRETCATLLQAADTFQFASIRPTNDKLLHMADDLVSMISDLNRYLK